MLAMVIDAARVIHSSGSLPRRSIRFVLLNGEEQGFLGTRAYVKAHRAELDHAGAAIVFDSGSGAISGYSVEGRGDMLPDLRRALDPLKQLGLNHFTNDAALETDNFDFLLEGKLPNLKRQSAIAAITAYALADSPQRMSPRQSCSQVEQLLHKTDLEGR